MVRYKLRTLSLALAVVPASCSLITDPSAYQFGSDRVGVDGGLLDASPDAGSPDAGSPDAGPSVAIDVIASTDQYTAGTSVSTPFSTRSPNELLLAFVNLASEMGDTLAVNGVEGGGLTWERVGADNVQHGDSEIWRAFAPTTLSNVTATVTLSGTAPAATLVVVTCTGVDLSGLNGAGAIGATVIADAPSGIARATVVTQRAGSLIVAVGNDWNGATARIPADGQTLIHQYLTPSGDTFWVQRVTATSSGPGISVEVSDVAPTSDRFNLVVAEILAAR